MNIFTSLKGYLPWLRKEKVRVVKKKKAVKKAPLKAKKSARVVNMRDPLDIDLGDK